MSPLDTELFQGADFAADIENRQSISGFLFKSNRTCVYRRTNSSIYSFVLHEAEYVGIAITSYEIYLCKLLADILRYARH
jgi:hypothetical protein